MTDTWDPAQYERFKAERSAPFYDLLGLVQSVEGGRVVDLGCGTGTLTGDLHKTVGAAQTVGIDNSDAMLAEARAVNAPGLTFEHGDIETFGTDGVQYDVVFSNAALQWVPDHPATLRRWTQAVADGGQIAVQVPANVDHPSHTVSAALGAELLDDPPPDPVSRVLTAEAYAELLHELGYTEQHVRLQVYGHVLPTSADVVEWVKGTSLTRFKKVMDAAQFDAFIEEYTRRLVATIGERAPYFYAFKRILVWARR